MKASATLAGWALLAALVIASPPASEAQDSRPAQDPLAADVGTFAEMSLEELSDVEVTSVSRRGERWAGAAAAIYVITPEDLRRSGATTLPEALRLAANLQVARADANQYAITARGYNSVLANKMLVLIDGRTVYSPLFSGVFWETQDVVLEDLARIEVISGPGGTLWGTNAVNGVINVITRPARETQGLLAAAGTGTREARGLLRLGGGVGEILHWRVFGKIVDVDATENAAGFQGRDASTRGLGGMRADWGDAMQRGTLMIGGSRGDIDQLPENRIVDDVHVLASWIRRLDADQELRVQAFFDRSRRDQPGAIRDAIDTWDLELQHGIVPAAGHELMWGLGARYRADRLDNLGPALAFLPDDRILRLFSAYAQHTVHARKDVDVVLGLRLEHNVYTGAEYLPSARVAWRPSGRNMVWSAYSRAVRAPSRIDRELFSPAAPPHIVLAGGPSFESEVANVYELGYRTQPSLATSLSITGYLHDTDRLRSLEPSPAGPVFANGFSGTTTGVAMWTRFRILPWWRIGAGYIEQRRTVRRDDGSLDPSGGVGLGNDPHRWGTVHLAFDVLGRHEIDVWLRHVGELPSPFVPDYTTANARVGIRLPWGVELAVTGTDLLGPRHAEWGVAPGRAVFERAVFAELRVRAWSTE